MDSLSGYNMLPPSLVLFLTEDVIARDRFMGMDDNTRSEFLKNAEKFQSKEEMERYIYHMENDEIK